MSSLLSVARHGKVVRPDGESYDGQIEYWVQASNSILTKAVNFQPTLRSCIACGDKSFTVSCEMFNHQIPVLPPFETMWFEAVLGLGSSSRRFAILVDRVKVTDIPPSSRADNALLNEYPSANWIVSLGFAIEHDGGLYPDYMQTRITLDASGVPMGKNRQEILAPPLEYATRHHDSPTAIHAMIDVCIHALARLNCRNVSLEVEGPKMFKPGKPRRGIVWHTIKVSDHGPHVRAMGPAVNCREYRSHWVRGHFADYTKGNGLFGKHKGLFWIPEHERGDEKNGKVIADYVVH